jgi:hypothetical protein
MGVAFHVADPLCGCGHCIVTQMHRGGASVIGLAAEAKLHSCLADGCGDDSELQVFAFEQRALLDVDFEIGEGVVA